MGVGGASPGREGTLLPGTPSIPGSRVFADAPRRPVHPVAGRRALGSTETRRCLVGRDRAQRACVYRTWDGVVLIHTSPFSKYFGGVYSVPGTAPLVQTLTSSEALHGRANKCASPEQLMGCLGARSPAAEARCWAGG